MAEEIKLSDGVLEASVPPAALEMFASSNGDRVVYRILDPNGGLIAGWPELASPPQSPSGLEPLYFDASFRGEAMRAVAILQPVASGTRGALVVVGQTLHSRAAMVNDLWQQGFGQQALILVAAAMLALFGLNRGLVPLLRLRDAIRDRKPDALGPLAPAPVQSELQPLVDALNASLERVRDQIALHRRFIADASHQLRTPLALLKTQAGVGLRETEIAAKDEALRAIDGAADSMARLANQLLTLARAETGSKVLRKETVDFAAIAQRVLEQLAEFAIAKHIDLGFECDDATDATLFGHTTLLHELVINLVDNALRYTPQGGTVGVSLRRLANGLELRVVDNGPGIAAGERPRVFERFYRALGSQAEGFGLGLAVVKEIVAAHDGSVVLADAAAGTGLVVEVVLPVTE